jgi:hypothetical protein
MAMLSAPAWGGRLASAARNSGPLRLERSEVMALASAPRNWQGRAPYAPPTLTDAGTFVRRTKAVFGFLREGFIGRFW